MRIDSYDGTSIAADEVGDGPPLVLVHGSWTMRHGWAFVVPDLAKSFRVVTYDRRGHGESGGEPAAGTVHDDADDLAAVIESTGAAPVDVVTSSYGGCVALRLVTSRPELVRRLVCHEPPLLDVLETSADGREIARRERQKLDEVRRLLEAGDHRAAAEHFVEEVALGRGSWALAPPPMQEMFVANAATFLGELRDPDALGADLDALASVDVPVTLTEGDQSPAFFAPILDALASLLPRVGRVQLPGVGHVPHATHPDVYVAMVRRALLEDASADDTTEA